MNRKVEFALAAIAFLMVVGGGVIFNMPTPTQAADPDTLEAVDGSGNSVTLTLAPCTNPELLKHIPVQVQSMFRAGITMYNGKLYQNCWSIPEGDAVVIIDTGEQAGKPDIYGVPIWAFQPKSTI